MVKCAVYIAAFFMVYMIFLSRDTTYDRNRFFIITSVIVSFILPLISIETKAQSVFPGFSRILSEISITGNSQSSTELSHGIVNFNTLRWITVIYYSGLVISAIKLMFHIFELINLIVRRQGKGEKIIRLKDLGTSGFSAFGFILLNNRLSQEESANIIHHEQNHIDQRHSIDILIIEIAGIFQWFNPFIHMFSRSLRAVHEYQADSACLISGMPVEKYQNLMLNQVFRSKSFVFTNCFSNPSLLKKRMIMMTKKPSGKLANLKLLIVLPVITAAILFVSSCSQKNNQPRAESGEIAPPPPPPPSPPPPPPPQPSYTVENGDTTWTYVEEMPQFPGGDAALLKFISENTKYPEISKKNNVQGKVIVRFCVEADGTVKNISILKSVDPDLDREAIRVVGTLPKFAKAGINEGKPVPVWYMVPINYTLK